MRDGRAHMTRCSVINLTVRLTCKVSFGQFDKDVKGFQGRRGGGVD